MTIIYRFRNTTGGCVETVESVNWGSVGEYRDRIMTLEATGYPVKVALGMK